MSYKEDTLSSKALSGPLLLWDAGIVVYFKSSVIKLSAISSAQRVKSQLLKLWNGQGGGALGSRAADAPPVETAAALKHPSIMVLFILLSSISL